MTRKEIKSKRIRKEKIKSLLFVNNIIIVLIENPREFIDKLSELLKEPHKFAKFRSAYKKNQMHFYTSAKAN